MNPRQRNAFDKPCLTPAETLAPEYSWKHGDFSICFTVNRSPDVHEGAPVWHVSVSWRGEQVSRWPLKVKKRALAMASKLLSGVGTGRREELQRNISLHLRRRLSADEEAAIDQDFLAAPLTG